MNYPISETNRNRVFLWAFFNTNKMIIQEAKRLGDVQTYYFAQKLKEIAALQAEGKQVINLGIGSPDLPPHPTVIAALTQEAEKAENHAYQPYKGIAALRNAMADFMQERYQVMVNPEKEILPLIGSKEGIFHIAMAFLNEGDGVLVPNPGYPAYRAVSKLTGANICEYTLNEAQNWRIDFESILAHDLDKVKICWVNFPNMPTGADANFEDLSRLLALAREHQFLVVNDNPYSMILNDAPKSIFQLTEAKEVAIELNSLSKSQNMAGWRIGWVAGEEAYINTILKVKSNMDSGMFKPVQIAASLALALPQTWYDSLNAVYAERKSIATQILTHLGCTYSTTQKGMFVWAKIPQGYTDAFVFSDKILSESLIFLTPGGIFGSVGNQFLRISLCSPADLLQEALNRISTFNS